MSDSLELKIFYPDAIAEDEIEDFNGAYELWRRVWIETREEVARGLPTPSDNFSRQSEILVLYSGNRPIGTICHRYVDLRHAAIIEDSFFNPDLWSQEARAKVRTMGRSCVLGSHIFIDPEFRKNASGKSTKNLLCALSFSHLNGTAPDVVVGMMRKDKGMHDVFYKSGAVTLSQDVHWYQIPVDLVAFFPARQEIFIDPSFKKESDEIGSRCPKFQSNYFNRNQDNKGKGNYESDSARSARLAG